PSSGSNPSCRGHTPLTVRHQVRLTSIGPAITDTDQPPCFAPSTPRPAPAAKLRIERDTNSEQLLVMFRGPRQQLGSVAQSGAGPDVVGVVIDATGREPAPDAPDDRRGARALLGGRRTPIGPGRRAANCRYPDRRDWRGGKFVWFSTVRSITFRVGTPPDASAPSRSTTSQSSPANPVPAVPSGPPIPRSPQARTTRIPTSPRSLAGWTGPWS